MSSKTAPDTPAPNAVAAGKRQRRPLSLAIRLAAVYGIAAFALLWLTCVYGYWSLVRSFEHEDFNFLSEEVEEVRMILASETGGEAALRDHLRRESAAHLSSPLFMRALHPDGQIIAECTGMSAVLPPTVFPRPAPHPARAAGERTLDDGRPVYMVASSTQIDGRPVIIQVAVDRTHEHRLLHDYRRRMYIVLTNGLMVCALIGYLI